MNERLNQRLSDWFDRSGLELVELNEALDAASCEEAAESLVIHGLLSDLGRRDEDRDAARILALMQSIDAEQASRPSLTSPSSHHKRSRRIAFLSTALTIAAAVTVMFVMLGPHQSVSAAMASLENVLEAAAQPFDRTYDMRVIEQYPQEKRPRNLPRDAGERESNEQIDGAKLYVRGADKYVFVRLLKDGRQRVSGCDGEQSWAFREDGPIHVSSDLSRFRGGMPGQKQDIPFINIHSHLAQLRTGYDVELMRDQPESSRANAALDHTVLARLVATRKSRDVQGPKQLEIWFNSENGTVHKMLLDGLPRRGGGPKSVSLELVDQNDLGKNFFSHSSHHEPGRRVRQEEPQS